MPQCGYYKKRQFCSLIKAFRPKIPSNFIYFNLFLHSLCASHSRHVWQEAGGVVGGEWDSLGDIIEAASDWLGLKDIFYY
jgi:hypothetical protein